MKTNVDFINSQEEAIYKDKFNKSKENDKTNDKNNSVMNIVKESIKEEDNEDNKDNKDINVNDKNNIRNDNNFENNKEKNNNENKNIKLDISINDRNNEIKEEDPLISHINIQENISEEEIKNASKLILEEIEGNLFNGKKIEINAGGMVGGRDKKDGFTIFGIKNSGKNQESNINNEENNKLFNINLDYELNYSENLPYPYIFAIYYKKEEKSYYIRAYSGKGSDNKILFIKLKNNEKYIIKQKEIISVGDLIFQINPIKNNFLEIIHLERKKFQSNIDNKQIFEGKKDKKVILGRSRECDFSFPKDKSFSRIQTTFEFDDNKKEWMVIDGKANKSSTNGTWIFGTHSFLIKNEMKVEILNSKIIIREIKNEKNNDEIK